MQHDSSDSMLDIYINKQTVVNHCARFMAANNRDFSPVDCIRSAAASVNAYKYRMHTI